MLNQNQCAFVSESRPKKQKAKPQKRQLAGALLYRGQERSGAKIPRSDLPISTYESRSIDQIEDAGASKTNKTKANRSEFDMVLIYIHMNRSIDRSIEKKSAQI
jgi:hypothetical protein